MFHYFLSGSIGKLAGAISVRAIFSILTAFIITFILIPRIIKQIRVRRVGQAVRDDGPQTHLVKEGRPTMGGVAIVISVLVTTLIWAKFGPHTMIMILVMLPLAAVGFADDLLKVLARNSKGVSARTKLIVQILTGGFLGIYIFHTGMLPPSLYVPVLRFSIPLDWFYIPFVAFVIVSTSNAVNLTDGLDGLATGVVTIVSLALGGVAYITGNSIFSSHVGLDYLPGSGELTVFCAAMVGAGLGFLWYNAPPAEIFMGDVGSLALGGALGAVSILTRSEILFVVIGGIFVLEALSVVIQVGSYRLRQKRVFRMAPIHHHFELSGWAESKVVVRFWIITMILMLAGLSIIGLNMLAKVPK